MDINKFCENVALAENFKSNSGGGEQKKQGFVGPLHFVLDQYEEEASILISHPLEAYDCLKYIVGFTVRPVRVLRGFAGIFLLGVPKFATVAKPQWVSPHYPAIPASWSISSASTAEPSRACRPDRAQSCARRRCAR